MSTYWVISPHLAGEGAADHSVGYIVQIQLSPLLQSSKSGIIGLTKLRSCSPCHTVRQGNKKLFINRCGRDRDKGNVLGLQLSKHRINQIVY